MNGDQASCKTSWLKEIWHKMHRRIFIWVVLREVKGTKPSIITLYNIYWMGQREKEIVVIFLLYLEHISISCNHLLLPLADECPLLIVPEKISICSLKPHVN